MCGCLQPYVQEERVGGDVIRRWCGECDGVISQPHYELITATIDNNPIRSAVREYVSCITSRPGMYAATREAFVAQLAALLELAGWPGAKLYEHLERRGAAYVDLRESFDETWAKKVGNTARAVVGIQPLK